MRRQSAVGLWNMLSRKMRRKAGRCEAGGCCYRLHVHHLVSRVLYPQFALNVNNLVVLCAGCHTRFHCDPVWGSEWLRANRPRRYEWAVAATGSSR